MNLTYDDNHTVPLQDLLCDLERTVIATMITANDGVKGYAADQLRLNRTTLVEKAKKYGFPIKKKGSNQHG